MFKIHFRMSVKTSGVDVSSSTRYMKGRGLAQIIG